MKTLKQYWNWKYAKPVSLLIISASLVGVAYAISLFSHTLSLPAVSAAAVTTGCAGATLTATGTGTGPFTFACPTASTNTVFFAGPVGAIVTETFSAALPTGESLAIILAAGVAPNPSTCIAPSIALTPSGSITINAAIVGCNYIYQLTLTTVPQSATSLTVAWTQ